MRNLKNTILSTLSVAVLALSTLTLAPSSFACSIYEGNADTVKDQIIVRLATALGIPASKITRENLSKPGISYIAGLGADCSGVEYAVRTSAYDITYAPTLFKKCTYKGVIVFRGIDVDHSELFLNNEPVNCINTIRPFPIPTPIIPVIR